MVDEEQGISEKLIKQFLTGLFTVGLTASGVVSGYGVLHGYLSRYTHLPLVGIPIASYFVAAGSLAGVTVPILIAAGIGGKIAQVIIDFIPYGKPSKRDEANTPDISTSPESGEKAKPSEKEWSKIAAVGAALLYIVSAVFILGSMSQEHRDLVFLITAPYLITVALCAFCVSATIGAAFFKALDYLVTPTMLIVEAPKSIIASLILVLCIAAYAIGLSQIYGTHLYGRIGLPMGGGTPSKVEVVFRDTADTSKLDFLKIPSSIPSGQAGPAIVCLLTPLGDDFLIYIPSEQATIILPKDQVLTLKDVFKDPHPDLKCNPPTP